LVGARMAVPFKDRLVFFGAIVQSSTTGPFYLQDTIVYSQNGTPYYTCSFAYATVNPSPSIIPTTTFSPVLLPTNQTGQPSAWWENTTGFGGFLSAGYARPITSVSINEDGLIVGLADRQARLLYRLRMEDKTTGAEGGMTFYGSVTVDQVKERISCRPAPSGGNFSSSGF